MKPGSVFAAEIKNLSRADRNAAIWQAALDGDLVQWQMRQVPCGPTSYFFAAEDYVSIGTEDEPLRLPMNAHTASRIATLAGCMLPTKLMVDLVWRAAAVRLAPITWGPPYDASMMSAERIPIHNARIEAARAGRRGLTAGQKKDIVLSNRLVGRPDRLAIYGWHREDGTPIQGPYVSLAHEDDYEDYSHGARLIHKTMVFKGGQVEVEDVLRDPLRCAALSDEGVLHLLTYLDGPAKKNPILLPAPSAPASSILQMGSRGSDVARWQAFLEGQGADPHGVDGTFWRDTQAATIRFQTREKIDPATGKVDAPTLARARALGYGEHTPELPAPPPIPPVGVDREELEVAFIQAKNYRAGRRDPVTGKKAAVNLCVIHSMQNAEKPDSAENVAAWFGGPNAPVASATYCIDCDSAVQCVREEDTPFAAPGANHDGIHIELAGRHDQGETGWADPYSTNELAIAAKIAAGVARRHALPIRYLDAEALLDPDARGFTTHLQVTRAGALAKKRGMTSSPFYKASTDHVDPGPTFPMDRFLAAVATAYADEDPTHPS